MRSTFAHLLVAILLVPSIMLVFTFPTVEGGNLSMDEEPLAGYSQQDGGGDDRLFEYRSLWMEGYQIVNLSEVKALVNFARVNNFNCLSPLINGHSLGVFYNSTIFPKYPEVKWDFDPLMELIKEAHKYNIHVMPWFHSMYNYPALRKNPEWGDMTQYGSRSSYWMDPSNAEVRDFLINETRELFENYPLDGIKLDTIRYGGSTYGYTPYAQQKYLDEGWNDYSDFRRNQVTEVVEIIYDTIMDISPWVWVGADIWHSYASWYNYVFQDSRTWAMNGKIDFVTTMSYTTSRSSFASNLANNLANFNVPVVSGPYVYVPGNTAHGSVPNEQAGIDLLVDQTIESQSQGALGTCNFAYKFLRDWPSYARALRNGPFAEKALCPLKEQRTPVKTTEWDFDKDHDRMGWRTTDTGQFYPVDGKWSVVGADHPGFMSPLLNITSWGINVIELTMISDVRQGNISIYWSTSKTIFFEHNRIDIELTNTADWELYSIHLDTNSRWQGPIKYVRIVTRFKEPTNITIDKIKMTWAPYCIRHWSYIGPFFTGSSEGLLERTFIDEEGSSLPELGDISSGRAWKSYHKERDKTDLGHEFGQIEDAVVYSHVYIRSTFEGLVEMRHGSSDGSRIWLNGVEIFRYGEPRCVSPDQNITYTYLNKGINTLLLKQAISSGEVSFFLRFTLPGNSTLDELEFFSGIPFLEPPSIQYPSEEWIPVEDIDLVWEDPKVTTGLDHYEISLDGGPYFRSVSRTVHLEDLSNGEHDVTVRCVDNLGFAGKAIRGIIRIDDEIPMITDPIADANIVHEQRIRWTWKDLTTPISGISGYKVTVIGWFPGSSKTSTLVEGVHIHEREYELSFDIDDGHRYSIRVTVFSGSGLMFNRTSKESVLVDSTPPTAPYGISIDHIRMGSMEYMVTWTESRENTREGLEHYEVWKSTGSQPWILHATTNDTSMVMERPVGYALKVKVRAKDRSSLYGDFSVVRQTENLAPVPHIIEPAKVIEGEPIEISTDTMLDPDGIIIIKKWFVDGTLVSSMDKLIITLEIGDHEIRFWVMDDQGGVGEDVIMVNVNNVGDYDPQVSIKGWLEDTSIKYLDLPPVNLTRYDNQTRYYENGTADGTLLMRTGLFDALMVVSSSMMILLLILVVLVMMIGEIKGYGMIKDHDEEEPSSNEDWEKKAMEDRRRFLESLAHRPVVKNLYSGHRSPAPGFPEPAVSSEHQLKSILNEQSIVRYQPPGRSEVAGNDEDLEGMDEWDEFEEVEY